MQKYSIIALYGKSGCGKDTIQQWVGLNYPNQFHEIVSCTTRPPRDYEEDGVDYNFLTVEEFTRQVLNGNMLEATEFRNWFYGTQQTALVRDKINIGVFNIAGIEALLGNPEIELIPVLVYTPDKQRLIRQLEREEYPDCAEICRRYQTDDADFSNTDFQPFFIWENYDQPNRESVFNSFQDSLARLLEKLD